MPATETSWEWSRADGLTEATIRFTDGEVAHVILRAQPGGHRAAHHGPRFIAIEDRLLAAFDVPLAWDRRTGLAL